MTIKGNINYQLFQFAYEAKGRLMQMIPQALVPHQKDLSGSLQIGITTYIDRYDQFFKPLYISLKSLFPEVNIYVAVNGFHEHDVQKKYLSQLENELCTRDMDGNTFVLHDKPVGLTRLWNELLSQGKCKTTLILNDDLRVYPWLRLWIENKCCNENITLINGTWSHFFFSRELCHTVGWFDETFRGMGFEDMDYTARCALNNIRIENIRCQYITHLDHQPSRTSFDDQTATLWGPKYSSINHDTFFQKWKLCDHDSGIFIKQLKSFVVANQRGTEKACEIELRFTNGVCYPDRE